MRVFSSGVVCSLRAVAFSQRSWPELGHAEGRVLQGKAHVGNPRVTKFLGALMLLVELLGVRCEFVIS